MGHRLYHVQRAWVAQPPRGDAVNAVRLGEGGDVASLGFLDVGHDAGNSKVREKSRVGGWSRDGGKGRQGWRGGRALVLYEHGLCKGQGVMDAQPRRFSGVAWDDWSSGRGCSSKGAKEHLIIPVTGRVSQKRARHTSLALRGAEQSDDGRQHTLLPCPGAAHTGGCAVPVPPRPRCITGAIRSCSFAV